MRITIIIGSHREKSQSKRVADFLARQLEKNQVETDLLPLSETDLPLWDEQVWKKAEHWEKRLMPLRNILRAADGFITVTPEYSGMAAPILKNFFLFFGKQDLGHKPALIAAVSSGRGGAYPISELRSSSYKNTGLCYIPEHLIFRDVEKLILTDNADLEGLSIEEKYIRRRSEFALNVLLDYAVALAGVREKGRVFSSEFSNGM